MSLKIKLKKFTASSGNPTTSDLENGEVGINPVQQKVFVNNSGSIVELGSAGGSSIDL